MTQELYEKNLTAPSGKIDVIMDTDAFNEVDDQFAISLMIKSRDKFNVQAITAAPFFNPRSTSPADGMEKSYLEILKLLKFAGRHDLCARVYRGSENYLSSESEYVESDAANAIIKAANNHTPENPLYVIAIAAITNVASALLKAPEIANKIVLVWLGGNPVYYPNNAEFNLRQDVAAARVVFNSDCPLISFPCAGVTETCRTTGVDLKFWLAGKNALCDYLLEQTTEQAEQYAQAKTWGRVLWDIVTVVWFLRSDAFASELIPAPVPGYNDKWEQVSENRKKIRCITRINPDVVYETLYFALAKND